MERLLVAKPATPETKTNDYRPFSLGHKPRFPNKEIFHCRKYLCNQPKLSLVRLQTKLEISQPGDEYEQEADRVAEQIMQMPQPKVQQQVEQKKEEQTLQTKELPGQSPVTYEQDVPPIVHEVLRSSGQPLDTQTRAFMEPRFGYDFSNVRVHTDEKAAKAAEAVNARAYTVGRDVVFGAGGYRPRTMAGKRLLAHELTHVIQQTIPIAAEKRLQRKSTRRTGLGRTKPKTECDAPICFPSPSETFGFEFDSDQLRPKEEKRLKLLAKYLAPDECVSILGYASVEGPEDYNLNLACHRAYKVKEILQQETLSTVRSIHAIGETRAFGPELAQNRVVQVFIHRPLPPPKQPTRPPETKPQPANCGCAGTWNVTRAVPAPSLMGLIKCRCTWYCTPPPGIGPPPNPTFGCGGRPISSRPGPGPRYTWGTKTVGSAESIESGDTCLCNRDDCMTNVGINIKKIE